MCNLPTSSADDAPTPPAQNLEKPLRVCLVRAQLWLMFDDIRRALEGMGHTVVVIDSRGVAADALLAELERAKPDLVFSINFLEGLPDYCALLRRPYVIWEIDPRMWISHALSSELSPWVHMFTYRKQLVTRHLAFGMGRVTHLPLATLPERRHPRLLQPKQQAQYGIPISFVGSSLRSPSHQRDIGQTSQALAQQVQNARTAADRQRWNEGLRILRNAMANQQQDLSKPNFIEVLSEGWRKLDLPLNIPWEDRHIDLRIVYGRMFGTLRRARVLQELADLEIAVYGDTGWPEVLDPRIQYRGPAGNGDELTTIYAASRINLDIGRLYQRDIVTLRVFDILGCRAFPLVEHSAELSELFDVGREVISYTDLKSLKEAATHYLAHPEEREQISTAGHLRVLQAHTIQLRLTHIIDRLHQRGTIADDSSS